MIIKTMRRTQPTFKQVLAYFTKDQHQLRIFHLLPANQNVEDLAAEFTYNYSFREKRKEKEVALYHEVISFPAELQQEASDEKLIAIAEHYISLRAKNNLCVGVIHYDQKHPHIHLMFSANARRGNQVLHQSNAEFKNIRRAMDTYLLKEHPTLAQDLVYLEEPHKRQKSRKNDKEVNLKKRKSNALTQIEYLQKI